MKMVVLKKFEGGGGGSDGGGCSDRGDVQDGKMAVQRTNSEIGTCNDD